MTIYACQNCDYETDDIDALRPLHSVPGLEERLDAGSVVPHGECPECQCFCYENTNWRLNEYAPSLLSALELLALAAEQREYTMGDPCRLLECKADLAEAAKQARAVIAKATGK